MVEEPIKAFVPQITRTVKAADQLVEQLSAPIDRVAPGLNRLADTLSAPALTSLPKDLGEFMDVLGDLARRLQPLGQMAESAGSMFGRMPWSNLLPGASRSEPAPRPRSQPTAAESRPAPPPLPRRPSAASTPAKRAPAKKSAGTTKKAAKKSPAKRTGGTSPR